jgi:hypothetical protein
MKKAKSNQFKQIFSDLKIDQSLTNTVQKETSYNKIKENIPLVPNYNFMADVLFLPKDKKGFRYCLVVVDLATDAFDIEPMKDKESSTVLAAFKKMIRRGYIQKPYASIRTDSGNEFQGVFQKYLYDESILHKVAKMGRHKQVSSAESLNRILGRLFNGYMNSKEEETGKPYREWTDIVDQLREKLNAYRLKHYNDTPVTHDYPYPSIVANKPPKFKVNDVVYVKLDAPENALGEKQYGTFREGDYRWDTVPRKITRILYYAGNPTYRYLVTGIPNVSYTEKELRPAKEKEEEYEVKQIIGKKKVGNKIMYKIWWKGYPKAEATWEPRENIADSAPRILREYEEKGKKK